MADDDILWWWQLPVQGVVWQSWTLTMLSYYRNRIIGTRFNREKVKAMEPQIFHGLLENALNSLSIFFASELVARLWGWCGSCRRIGSRRSQNFIHYMSGVKSDAIKLVISYFWFSRSMGCLVQSWLSVMHWAWHNQNSRTWMIMHKPIALCPRMRFLSSNTQVTRHHPDQHNGLHTCCAVEFVLLHSRLSIHTFWCFST